MTPRTFPPAKAGKKNEPQGKEAPFPQRKERRVGDRLACSVLSCWLPSRWRSGSRVREESSLIWGRQPCLRTSAQKPKGTCLFPQGLCPASCIFSLGTACSVFWKNLGVGECAQGVVGGVAKQKN